MTHGSDILDFCSLPGRLHSQPQRPLCRLWRGAVRFGLADLAGRFREFAHPDAIITAPESRSSSPVRIDRHPETFESSGLGRLFPLGEGAGFAGGILSAALDGMRAAENWMSNTTSIGQP